MEGQPGVDICKVHASGYGLYLAPVTCGGEAGQEGQDGAQSQQGHSAKTNREQGADGENAGRLMMEVVTV